MISIAIPTYEMNGVGSEFIRISLNQISKQIYKDFEVVISDHSENDDIKCICDEFKDLRIKYIKNKKDRGSSSANLNNAILHCEGDLIKFLMQDEFLLTENSLSKIVNHFDMEKTKWLVTGRLEGKSLETPTESGLPDYIDEYILDSVNTIGSPSVLTIKNEDLEFFTDNLLWVMDLDYYKRLYDKFGYPTILNEYIVFITRHKDQVTHLLEPERKISEQEYLKRKYIK